MEPEKSMTFHDLFFFKKYDFMKFIFTLLISFTLIQST